MARVALAVPFYDTRFIRPVLGPRYLVSFLEARGHQVLFADAGVAGLGPEPLARKILAYEPDIVSLSAAAPQVLLEGLNVAGILRDGGFFGHISVGGYMAAFEPEEILLRHQEIDSAVAGEGEPVLAVLAELCGSGERWKDAPGIAFLQDGRVVRNPGPEEPADLDTLPLPFREPGYNPTGDRVFGIQTSRGCLNSCTFCQVPRFYGEGRGWRARAAKSVAKEAQYLKDEFGARGLILYDDNLFGPTRKGFERGFELAGALEGVGGLAIALPASPGEVKRDLFMSLKAAGLRQVFLSLESGAGGVLKRLGRPHSLKGSKNAVKVLKDLGIDIEPGFIMFEPDSTLEDLGASIAFLERLGLASTPAVLNRLEVRPGCPLAGELEERGLIVKRWPYMDYRSLHPEVDEVLNIARRVMNAAFKAEYIYLRLRHESHLSEASSSERGPLPALQSRISDKVASVFSGIVEFVAGGGELAGARERIESWRDRLSKIEAA